MGTTNLHAKHSVNAMLNYAYAVMESRLRIAAVAAGLDPTVGYMHARHPGRLALVYDLMEPLRPKVDEMVLQFVREHTFSPSDFVVTATGVCRLHPRLARQVSGLTVTAEGIDAVVRRTVTQLMLAAGRTIPKAISRWTTQVEEKDGPLEQCQGEEKIAK